MQTIRHGVAARILAAIPVVSGNFLVLNHYRGRSGHVRLHGDAVRLFARERRHYMKQYTFRIVKRVPFVAVQQPPPVSFELCSPPALDGRRSLWRENCHARPTPLPLSAAFPTPFRTTSLCAQ